MKIIIANSFHNNYTHATLRSGQASLSVAVTRRVEKELCGLNYCYCCISVIKTDKGKKIPWRWDQDKDGKYFVNFNV